MSKEKINPKKSENHNSSSLSKLIVYNDDFNTFGHVINTLIEVCGHNPEQAEQCTMIIHHKGKCPVKSGDTKHLSSMCKKITERRITAKIE